MNGKEITFTFGAAEDTAEDYIDNITIEYRTRALNYFSENGIAHKYSNSASLSVTAGETSYGATDTADKWIANHILAKTAAYEFDDGENRGYMHYAVTVNGDGTNLGGVTVSDDLAGYNEATRINDLAGNCLLYTSRRWKGGCPLGTETNPMWCREGSARSPPHSIRSMWQRPRVRSIMPPVSFAGASNPPRGWSVTTRPLLRTESRTTRNLWKEAP